MDCILLHLRYGSVYFNSRFLFICVFSLNSCKIFFNCKLIRLRIFSSSLVFTHSEYTPRHIGAFKMTRHCCRWCHFENCTVHCFVQNFLEQFIGTAPLTLVSLPPSLQIQQLLCFTTQHTSLKQHATLSSIWLETPFWTPITGRLYFQPLRRWNDHSFLSNPK